MSEKERELWRWLEEHGVRIPGEREFYRWLQEQGLWNPRPSDQRPPAGQKPFKPVEVKGKPLSRMIIEDRR